MRVLWWKQHTRRAVKPTTTGDSATEVTPVIRSSNGEDLIRTEIGAEQGATQSVTFTATEEMATYLCELHPTSMVGDVSARRIT